MPTSKLLRCVAASAYRRSGRHGGGGGPVRVVRRPATYRLVAAVLAGGCFSAGAAGQEAGDDDGFTTIEVTSFADSGPGTLREALNTANGFDGTTVINFDRSGRIPLQSQLEITSSVVLSAPGGRVTLDGIDQSTRLLNIETEGAVRIERFDFVNGGAQGGNGGNGGFAGGGGGAGLGGAVFIESGNVSIADSTFRNNRAIGGNGGQGDDTAVGGDDESFLGGSGGGGASAGSNGIGAASPADGLSFVNFSPQVGGDGGTADPDVTNPGGARGLGTAADPVPGEAGTSGQEPGDDNPSITRNNGGGGGGGPSLFGEGGNGGDGGFGGGGGAGDGEQDDDGNPINGLGGDGGFGGGGGAGSINREDDFEIEDRGGVNGIGGGLGELIDTAAGTEQAGDGGGGAGLGGAIFVAPAATLTLEDIDFNQVSGNTVTQGLAGGNFATPITLTDDDPAPAAGFNSFPGAVLTPGMAPAGDGGATGTFVFSVSSPINLVVNQDATLNPRIIGDPFEVSNILGLLQPFSQVQKLGEGTLTLIGDGDPLTDDSGFTGNIRIFAGDLIVDASFSGDNIINTQGGTLLGNGTVGLIQNETGRVNPGVARGEIGTLTVDGDFEQRAAANLDLEFGEDGVDSLVITGTASLNGDVNFIEVDGGVAEGVPFTFLDIDPVTGNVLGAFDNINFQFLDNGLVTVANVDTTGLSRTVTFDRIVPTLQGALANASPFGASLGNQIVALQASADPDDVALGNALEAALLNGAPLAVNGQFNPQIAENLDSQTNRVSDAAAAGAASAVFQTATVARGRVSGVNVGGSAGADAILFPVRTYDDLFGAGQEAPESLADDGDPFSAPEDDALAIERDVRPVSVWAEGIVGRSEIDADENGPGTTADTFGVAAGGQLNSDDGSLVGGVFVGFTETEVEVDGRDDQSDIENIQVGLYGVKSFGNGLSLNGTVSYSQLMFDNTRAAGTGTATSDPDAFAITGSLELLQDLSLSNDSVLAPFIGLEYSYLDRDGFTESGAGVLNLSVDGNTEEFFTGIIGFQYAGRIEVGDTLRLTPAVRIAYARQFGDESATTTSSFAALPGATFTTTGAERGENSVRLGLGLELGPQLSNRWSVYARYLGDYANSGEEHTGQLGVSFSF